VSDQRTEGDVVPLGRSAERDKKTHLSAAAQYHGFNFGCGSRRAVRTLKLIITFTCFSLGLGSANAEKAVSNSEKPNVVLLVVDTLRADYLPFYGYQKNTAPYLNSLAENGALFLNTFSTSSWTAPATASILTSLYPHQHGVLMGRRSTRRIHKSDPSIKLNAIPNQIDTLAEILKESGYRTFAVTDNGNLRKDAGFAQGFDYFKNYENVGADSVNQQVKAWKSEITASSPYLLYLQYMDPHQPYTHREPWPKATSGKHMVKVKHAYESEIHYTDQHIRELAEMFDWNTNTIVVLTADHGEEFLDHGQIGHGKSLYAEVVRVPLLIYYPNGKIKKIRVSGHVSVIDIVPTILELAGIQTENRDFDGIGLAAEARGEAQVMHRVLYAGLWRRRLDKDPVKMKSALNDQERFVRANHPRQVHALFDVVQDPQEKKNILDKKQQRAEELELAYDAYEAEEQRYQRRWVEFAY